MRNFIRNFEVTPAKIAVVAAVDVAVIVIVVALAISVWGA